MSGSTSFGKFLYGALFCVVIPALLFTWWFLLDKNLEPISFVMPEKVHDTLMFSGIVFFIAGALLLAAGMNALIRNGKGLPMNAFPPKEYVSSGVYAIVRHPIYTGFSLMAFGVACYSLSATAIYVIAPITIAGCFALVYGYENDAIEQHFGKHEHRTMIGLYPGPDRKLSWQERIGGAITAFLPWIVIYEMDVFAGPSSNWISTATIWDLHAPLIPEFAFAYTATYVFVGIVPFTIGSSKQMRHFILDAITAILIAGFIFLVFPFYYEGKTVTGNGVSQSIIAFERSIDGTAGALPSFHVIWALLAAFHIRGPGIAFKTFKWFIAIAIVLSCFLTGIHSVMDVIAGAAVVVIARKRNAIWNSVQSISERIANSWKEWHIGPLRIINHSIYAGLSSTIGVLIIGQFIPELFPIVIIGICSMIGAALWGQFVEGSAKMLRPFGYFGSIIGGIIGIEFALNTTSMNVFQLTAAIAMAAPIIQAVGRLRCLVQGCCHGKASDTVVGIHAHHPSSRICAAGLSHKNIHNTQLYSIVFNIIIAGILWRLYYAHVPASVITGMYFVLTGLSRFVEENYRGEPQTKIKWGLRIYQWASIFFVIVGIVLTCVPSPVSAPFTPRYDSGLLITSLVSGFLYAFAMGMDFPKSTRRFSRLTG